MVRTVLCFAVLVFLEVQAGLQAASYRNGARSSLSVSGTSTLHPWEEKAVSFDILLEGEEDPGASFQAGSWRLLSVAVPVTNLRSAEPVMDQNAWKSLKYEAAPMIRFFLSTMEVSAPGAAILSGSLSIAGVTREIRLPVSFTNGHLKGRVSLSLSAFEVKTPVLFGFIKVGDEVAVQWDVVLSLSTSSNSLNQSNINRRSR